MKHDICFVSCHHWKQEVSSKWQQARTAFMLTKKYQHHSAQAQFTQTFMLPQICNVFIYIFPLPRNFKLQIIAYYIWKQLKCKLSSWWKKESKSFNSSKINVAQTSCKIEEWFSDVQMKVFYTHTRLKIKHAQLKNVTFLLDGGKGLVWDKKGYL